MERIAIATLTCSACGAPARPGDARCAYCGSAFLLAQPQPPRDRPSGTVSRPTPRSQSRRGPGRRLALAALALLGLGLAAWFPAALPGPIATLLAQAHFVLLLIGTVGWLGAETPRQVRPWSILLLFTFAALAVVIATRQATGTALPTGATRFAHLTVLTAGVWLASIVWSRRRGPVRRRFRRTVDQPAW